MPLYEYQCECGKLFEEFFTMTADSSRCQCQCGKVAKKIYSVPNLKTDTNFFGTGMYDNRVCDNPGDKIEGRKDWNRRLEKKGLVEIDSGFLNQPVPKPEPCL
jgi:putative FmdB family regulatory protein